MSEENNKGAEEKSMLHPRSKHRQRYDFKSLNAEIPQLKHYVTKNKYGNESINFADPRAVKTLNQPWLIFRPLFPEEQTTFITWLI
jgi:23S rRNA (adenine1618-N6)-methyltransferase